MNEPGFEVGVLLLGLWLVVPLLLALAMAVASLTGVRAIWLTWAIGYLLIAFTFWTLTENLRATDNPADTRLAVSILIGTAGATALAAFALTRVLRQSPRPGVALRALLATGTTIGGIVLWAITPGAC